MSTESRNAAGLVYVDEECPDCAFQGMSSIDGYTNEGQPIYQCQNCGTMWKAMPGVLPEGTHDPVTEEK